MSTTVRKMDAQLKTWHEKIDRLAAQNPPSAAANGLESTGRIDELRALHAAALTEFTGFRVADAAERAILKPQTVVAWNALAAAIRTPKPTS